MSFKNFKKLMEQTSKKAVDMAEGATKSARNAVKSSELKKKFTDAGRVIKEKTVEIAKKSPKQHVEDTKKSLEASKKAFVELKDTVQDMDKDETVEFLMETYKGMSKSEALKLTAALIVPGGIPVWALMKLNEFKNKKKDQDEQLKQQSVKISNQNQVEKKSKSQPKQIKKNNLKK